MYNNTTVFVCETCVADCSCKERIFGLGFRDGKLSRLKDTTGISPKYVGYYHAGYLKGFLKRK